MADVVRDSTDPLGALRPYEAPGIESSHTFSPRIVGDRPYKMNLPPNVKPDDAYAIFSLFFTDDILAIIVHHINLFAAKRQTNLQQIHPNRKKRKTLWKDTTICELRAFLGFLIYRSTIPFTDKHELWTADQNMPMHPILFTAITRDRCEELEASLHISDPNAGGDIFAKLEPLNSHLLTTAKTLWQPGSESAVDEAGCRFVDQIRASFLNEQQQVKEWKVVFYTIVDVITVNSYLLSVHSSVAKEKRFKNQRAFRKALYIGLFEHSSPLQPAQKDQIHYVVDMKRAACVVCKWHTIIQRRIKIRQERLPPEEIPPNLAQKRKDAHVKRTRSGCDVCKVNLCLERTGRPYWEEFHHLPITSKTM